MRDPKRIRPLLERLALVWLAYPDLRLGQIVGNAFNDAYHVEDEALIGAIERIYIESAPATQPTVGKRE